MSERKTESDKIELFCMNYKSASDARKALEMMQNRRYQKVGRNVRGGY